MKLQINQFRKILQEELPRLMAEYSVDTLKIFGSFIRGEETPDSDLDILVTFQTTPGLIRFISLENELTDLLGIKVDLVMQTALKPRTGDNFLAEAISIL